MTKKRGRRGIALLMTILMILSLIPTSVYATGPENEKEESNPVNVWIQEIDKDTGAETDKKYEVNENDEIRI